ncbi:MAG TPA: Gfo/Idh/MocA family oxidoreductase, partial [Rhodocyclaceae bacterium]|nr:Gfo/Idh/MocA family oxidoreductase [Rhodocyclaceae bacterium]
AYQRRMSPDNLVLKKLFDRQAFGRIYAVDLACKFWRDQAYYDSGAYRGGLDIDGGGPFIQQASHNIDLYIWFFGMPSKVVSMMGTFAHDIEAEDHGAVLFKHDNGMIGTVVASTAARPGFPARLEVHCEKGSFSTIDDRIAMWAIDDIGNPAHAVPSNTEDSSKNAAISDTSRHEAIIRDFEAAVREKRQPLADAASARQTTELILKIYGRI